jgi:hypothetical protein
VVIIHDFFADRQTNSGTGVLTPSVQPLKYFENFMAVFKIKSDPVIGKGNVKIVYIRVGMLDIRLRYFFDRNPDHRRDSLFGKLNGIAEDVGKELSDLKRDNI